MKLSLISLPVKDPIVAHEVYTKKLGFKSKRFEKDSKIAIIESPDINGGTSILLEPCEGNFLENYQQSAYNANLPIMVFSVKDVKKELYRLKDIGIKLRPELDKPEWEIENLFEDGCGNLIMIEEEK